MTLGMISLTYLTVIKLFFEVGGISDRPLFFFGVLSAIIGTQLFLTGFLAELVINTRSRRNQYNISEELLS